MPWPGIRVVGPSPTASMLDGIRTSDANGEVVFSNLASFSTVRFTNFAPLRYGGAEANLTLEMPTSNHLLVWTMSGAPPVRTVATTSAVTQLDAPVYYSVADARMRFSVTRLMHNTISLIPLAKGMRVKIYDELPGGDWVDIDRSSLRFVGQGVWLVETKTMALGQDESKATIAWRLLFVVK